MEDHFQNRIFLCVDRFQKCLFRGHRVISFPRNTLVIHVVLLVLNHFRNDAIISFTLYVADDVFYVFI